MTRTEALMKVESASIAALAVNSSSVAVGSSRSGSFQVGTIEGTEITVEMSNNGTNFTAAPSITDDPNPLTVTTNGTYPIPAIAFRAKFIRFVSNAGGGENAAVTISVILKG